MRLSTEPAQAEAPAHQACSQCLRPVCQAILQSPRQAGPGMHKLTRGARMAMTEGSCQRIWVILSGMAAISTGLADGRRQIVTLELPGNIVCGLAAMTGSESWLEALSDCEICELSLQGLDGPLSDHPDLVSELFGLIHARVLEDAARMVMLGRLDSMERVTLFLLEIGLKHGLRNGNAIHVELPMTREDIADYLGLNAETVSRLFTRLKKTGLVRFPSRSSVNLTDIAALERRIPVQSPTAMPPTGAYLAHVR